MITENGITASDDRLRTAYLKGAIAVVQRLRGEGLPLRGYIHWSLLDNFEWGSGYKPRFGLYAVDRSTFVRTAKPSAALFRTLVARASGPGGQAAGRMRGD
jgi:beta-glucosidase